MTKPPPAGAADRPDPPNHADHAISDVLDRLEEALHEGDVTVGEVMSHLGQHSFPALILLPALISASPASAVPGVTAVVALIVATLVVQMLAGRRCAWLPQFLARRRIASDKLGQGVRWLRRPVNAIERVVRPRLTAVFHRPLLYLPLLVILAVACVMPFLEVIPLSGSIASVAVALFATGLLTRDGLLVLAGLGFVGAVGVLAARWLL